MPVMAGSPGIKRPLNPSVRSGPPGIRQFTPASMSNARGGAVSYAPGRLQRKAATTRTLGR